MRRWGWSALWLGGCSLVVDQEVRPSTCQRSAQCAVLNDIDGLALDARRQWFCPPGAPMARVCTLGDVDEDGDRESPVTLVGGTDCDDADPRRAGRLTESPDGVDNDCDGVIDEGVWAAGTPVTVGTTAAGPASWWSSLRTDGRIAVAVTSAARVGSVGTFDGATLGFSPLSYQAVYREFSSTREMPGVCPSREAPSGSGCDFRDLATAEVTSGVSLVASISAVGCSGGQVRLGWYAAADSAVVLDASGDGRGSNVALGVDVGASPPCTGASRMPSVLGASRPTVAALPTGSGETPCGLAAWLARSADATGCGASAEVEALGVWLAGSPDERNVARTWVTATDGGRPRGLGATAGGGRPAVVALGRATGFVVAFGRAAGGVALRAVPAFTVGAGATTEGLDVTAGELVVGAGAAGASATVDEVVVAPGATRDGRRELGVAWKEGCGASGSVRFARMQWEAGNPAASVVSAVVTVAASGAAQVAVAYVDRGLRVVGTRVEGRAVGETDDGGWVVAWVDTTQPGAVVRARRVSELDGGLLGGDGEAVAVVALTGLVGGLALGPGGEREGRVRYLVQDTGMARWLGGSVLARGR